MGVSNQSIPDSAEEKFYLSAESTFGTFVAPTTDHALRIKKSTFTPDQERVPREDKRGSRSLEEMISRKKTGDWSLLLYACPSGTAGTVADEAELTEAIFGTETIVGATSVTYSLNKDINKSFTLHRIAGEVAESIVGAVPSRMVIRGGGDKEVEIEYSGFAADFIHTTHCVLAASAASGATTISITSAEKYICVNSIVQVDSNDNSGSGYKVTAISGASVTITPALEADCASATNVNPYFPTTTTVGSPLGCFPGSIECDSAGISLSEFEVTIENNVQMQNDIFGEETAIGFFSTAVRAVSFTAKAYAASGYGLYRGHSVKFTDIDIAIVCGETAGSILTINIDQAELKVISYEFPAAGQVTFDFNGVGKATSAHEDEIEIVYT